VFTKPFILQALPELSGSAPHSQMDGQKEWQVDRFETDSRRPLSGAGFVALKGEKFDGNAFAQAAADAGARLLILGPDAQLVTDHLPVQPWVVRVADPEQVYRQLAIAWAKQWKANGGSLIAICGSVGKTTTKEFLSAILTGKGQGVCKTLGSQNGFLGIPMTLLQLRPEHSWGVIEIGIDDVGTMVRHLETVQPDAGILTTIGPEHLERLIDLSTVAREEFLTIRWLTERGRVAVASWDDPWVRTQLGDSQPHSLCVTQLTDSPEEKLENPPVASRLAMYQSRPQEDSDLLLVSDASLEIPLRGRHNAQNLLLAVSLARQLGFSFSEIQQGLTRFVGAPGRSEVRKSARGQTVICDYYNSQPASLRAALALLDQCAQGRRRFACLGDMLELGAGEEALHREFAPLLIQLKVEGVFLYGSRMKWLWEELHHAKQSGHFRGELEHFSSLDEMANAVLSQTRPQDVVLIKGSNSLRMSEVWKFLA
jgi:UDP-N-acetylmuramoyl-tripeptide--D-alanyl-D-alanine ligase